jgi:hypothetical protein
LRRASLFPLLPRAAGIPSVEWLAGTSGKRANRSLLR